MLKLRFSTQHLTSQKLTLLSSTDQHQIRIRRLLVNVVVFGDAQADRSPCGTGTSAKLATLHKWGELGVGEEFIYESFMGTRFKGVIKEETKIGDYDAVIPMVTGTAYLTGVATYIIDGDDPLKYGFLIG